MKKLESPVRRLGLIVVAAELCACGGDRIAAPTASATSDRPQPAATLPPDEVPYFPDATWRTASPDEVGVPSDVLARVGQRIASSTWRGLDSFIVIRRGYVVHETYYGSS